MSAMSALKSSTGLNHSRFVVIASLLVAFMLLWLPKALADDVTWSIKPAPTSAGVQENSFAWVLKPGQTQTGQVVITNHSSHALTLDLAALDATTTQDGHLDLVLDAEKNSSLGKWITLASTQVNIPSGESQTVDFTLNIPAEAAPGDYSAGIASIYRAEGTTVAVTHRNATRVDVRLPGKLSTSHTVKDLAVEQPSTFSLIPKTPATITYSITNTGNTRQYVKETVQVSSLFGLLKTQQSDTLKEILPGKTVNRTVKADAFAFGPGNVQVQTRSFAVDESSGSGTTLNQGVTAWPFTWLILIVVALVVGVLLGMLRSRKTNAADSETADGEGS